MKEVEVTSSIAWFRDLTREDIPTAGGKGANLGEMYNAKLPIPPGFVVTAQAYKLFLDKTNLGDDIYPILKTLDVNASKPLQDASEKIQKLIVDAHMPEEIAADIREAYDMLNVDIDVYRALSQQRGNPLGMIKGGREKPYVAVRSSATAEDLPEASFAGQQATFLNVKGADEVVKAVQKCWASLFTARAIYYRTKNNFAHDKTWIAVIVQRMVNSDIAGVMFSVNPSTNNRDEIMIEAAFGLGEAVVGGEVTPDTYIVDKKTMQIKSKKIAKQTWGYFRQDGKNGNSKRTLTPEKGAKQKLNDDEIRRLAEFAVKIERHYGAPQDMEWAVEGIKMMIVQSRAVTTLLKKREESVSFDGNAEKILSGLAASPGVGSGKVKILRGPEELEKVQKGNVLVTKMTSPDYVPAMQKAAAIVTDEGGMTCFAGDTLVLTDMGFIEMREAVRLVQEGKQFFIFAYNYKRKSPEWKKVINGGRRIRKDILRISVSQTNKVRHNTIDLTADHKMYTFAGLHLIKKQIHEILKENEAVTLVEKLPSLKKEYTNQKFAYLAGALMSDGNTDVTYAKSGNPRRGRITFTQKEIPEKEAFIAQVKAYFNEIFLETFSYERVKESTGELRGRAIQGYATDFISFKLAPAQQMMKLIGSTAQWASTFNEECALAFLAGLIDGDGCLDKNRLHIYVSKKYVLEGVIVSCLRLGIIPQITINRDCNHVQILERVVDILQYTTRVKGVITKKIMGNKLFAAKQLLGDVIDEVNVGGKIKPYVENNLLLDSRKIKERIIPMAIGQTHDTLKEIVNAHIRMQRVRQIESFSEQEVFNLEVSADNELDHNYVVFTKKYTPLLVSNSHAAIVSREMGIPCIVGSEKATELLHDGDIVTVDGTHGIVYKGAVEGLQTQSDEAETMSHEDVAKLKTKTKIYMNLGEPEKVGEYKSLPFDGIGLMRLEFIITSWIGKHPLAMMKAGESKIYVQKLAEGIRKVAQAIQPRPMIVRFSDFKTNEYRNLDGGEEFEPHEENPLIGWRGVSRYVHPDFKEAFKLECRAIKQLHNEGLGNIHVMLPFVRKVDEVKQVLEIMKEEGLENGKGCKVYLMAEVPSIALIPEEFAQLDITGASIGSNDLTQGVLGIDRDSARLGKMGYFDERNPAVLVAMKRIIEGFQKYGKTVGICGQSVSVYPEITEFLIKQGINSVSVSPDVVFKTRKLVYDLEK